ncbi:MAG: hypothetical protein OEM28_03445 [Nitrosopumilus sp.]|nr:hypothetical protein [Nitrosopumilus sp.]MDH3487405.1 hypothetical protein [Nitrosopumilus sp.]
MVHHKLPEVAEKLQAVKTDVAAAIHMVEEEKSYPVIMQKISEIHSELNKAEQLIVDDLAEHDLLRVR